MNTFKFIFIISFLILLGCKHSSWQDDYKKRFLVDILPDKHPIEFMPSLVSFDRLIHRGVFTPDLKEYYYTVSDNEFKQFDIYLIKWLGEEWSQPEKSFFNSNYSEHGVSFSSDGHTLYFSSTRPSFENNASGTWRIWRSLKVDGKWEEPELVNIPGTKNKFVSHPSISDSATLYYHMSNLDYSEMDIYYSRKVNGKYSEPEKIKIPLESNLGKCTPHISPKEDYMVFAAIGEQLDLMVSFKNDNGDWGDAKRLNDKINTLGRGNPYVTPDGRYLFYASSEHPEKKWKIKWINFEEVLKQVYK